MVQETIAGTVYQTWKNILHWAGGPELASQPAVVLFLLAIIGSLIALVLYNEVLERLVERSDESTKKAVTVLITLGILGYMLTTPVFIFMAEIGLVAILIFLIPAVGYVGLRTAYGKAKKFNALAKQDISEGKQIEAEALQEEKEAEEVLGEFKEEEKVTDKVKQGLDSLGDFIKSEEKEEKEAVDDLEDVEERIPQTNIGKLKEWLKNVKAKLKKSYKEESKRLKAEKVIDKRREKKEDIIEKDVSSLDDKLNNLHDDMTAEANDLKSTISELKNKGVSDKHEKKLENSEKRIEKHEKEVVNIVKQAKKTKRKIRKIDKEVEDKFKKLEDLEGRSIKKYYEDVLSLLSKAIKSSNKDELKKFISNVKPALKKLRKKHKKVEKLDKGLQKDLKKLEEYYERFTFLSQDIEDRLHALEKLEKDALNEVKADISLSGSAAS